jgi:hypothetical protein
VKCTTCDAEMLPLATSAYCPNDCDRVPRLIIEGDDEPTHPFMRTIDVDAQNFIDPNCKHEDVGPFEVRGFIQHHCWGCGAVLP